jgi:hypothetical protein
MREYKWADDVKSRVLVLLLALAGPRSLVLGDFPGGRQWHGRRRVATHEVLDSRKQPLVNTVPAFCGFNAAQIKERVLSLSQNPSSGEAS